MEKIKHNLIDTAAVGTQTGQDGVINMVPIPTCNLLLNLTLFVHFANLVCLKLI